MWPPKVTPPTPSTRPWQAYSTIGALPGSDHQMGPGPAECVPVNEDYGAPQRIKDRFFARESAISPTKTPDYDGGEWCMRRQQLNTRLGFTLASHSIALFAAGCGGLAVWGNPSCASDASLFRPGESSDAAGL